MGKKNKMINKIILTLALLIFSNGLFADMGTIGISIRPFDKKIKSVNSRTLMITVFQNSKAVAQKETNLSTYVSFSKLEPGKYNVRFEGEGLETLEKHGILVFENKTTELKTYIHLGSGTKIIQYSTTEY